MFLYSVLFSSEIKAFMLLPIIGYCMTDAHIFETTVQNVRDDDMAVAVAMGWVRDELDSVDLADVDTFSEPEGVRVQFCARFTEKQVEIMTESDGFQYLGVI